MYDVSFRRKYCRLKYKCVAILRNNIKQNIKNVYYMKVSFLTRMRIYYGNEGEIKLLNEIL